MALHRHNKGGLTLLEMLAAISMVAILTGSLYACLRSATRARDSALRSVDSVHKIDLAMDLIRADLQAAVAPRTDLQSTATAYGALSGPFVGVSGQTFAGSMGDDLVFYAACQSQPAPGSGEIKKIEYTCQPADGAAGALLVRQVTGNLLSTTVPDPQTEVIARGVSVFALRYFDGQIWDENWDSTSTLHNNTLPKAIEVTLELKDDAGNVIARGTRIFPVPCGVDVTTQQNASSSSGGTP